MNFKQIEKASKYYDRIKAIDTDIIEIEKLAQIAASSDSKATIKVSIEKPKEEENEKVRFDEDGSIQTAAPQWSIDAGTMRLYIDNTESTDNEQTVKQEVRSRDTLTILGYLLAEKNRERNWLIGEIEKLSKEYA